MSALLRTARLAVLALAAALAATAPGLAQPERLPVPAITIYPGDIIEETMLATGTFPAGTALNYPVVADVAGLVGKIARRTLLPGRLIARNTVTEPDIVSRGTVVEAQFRSGGLIISAQVLALQSGGLHDFIQARNVDSGKVIAGIVQPDGSIRIGGL